MDAIKSIVKFQKDRELDKKPFNDVNEQINIVEELLEAVGLDVTKENRIKLEERWVDFISDIEFEDVVDRKTRFVQMMEDEKVDAFGDIIVFAVGAILKLGYDPERVLLEIGKEINSREGSMIGGKFEKDLSIEAMAKWYRANFAECKTKDI